jgi:hypothetical protein
MQPAPISTVLASYEDKLPIKIGDLYFIVGDGDDTQAVEFADGKFTIWLFCRLRLRIGP